jgi:subtilisin family serine protease
MTGIRRITVVAAIAVGVACGSFASVAVAAEPVPPVNGSIGQVNEPVPDQYIVTLRTDDAAAVPAVADALAGHHDGQVLDVYQSALHGFSVHMDESDAAALAADPAVASVEEDGYVHATTVQSPAPSWGIDRVDERNFPLDSQYSYAASGANVHAYVIDTGIVTSHADFGGRASVGIDEIGGGACATSPIDESGHGTHVAGTIGGATYGVAKSVSLVSVRVLNCSGSGTNGSVIAGVDWVTDNAIKPAVANMSLGGSSSSTIDDAIRASIASGVTYVVAAGNANKDACTTSPADVTQAITVGATGIYPVPAPPASSASDGRSSFSNWGPCLDLFAPGAGIKSDWDTSTTATNVISGTSMAAPHVTGAAALFLSRNPDATPDDVAAAILGNASTGKVTGGGSGSPDRLLYTGYLPPSAPEAPIVTATGGIDGVHLAWTTPVDGGSPITGYAIYRSTSPGGEGAVPLASVSGVDTLAYLDATAVGGTTYYYEVAAVNAGGETRSDEQSATPLTPSAPAAPALTATGANGHVVLSWNIPSANGSPLTGFTVSRGTTSGSEAPLAGQPLGPGATSFDDTTVTNGTTYFYKVSATNGFGSTPSAEQIATPLTSNGAYFPLTPARIMDSRTGNGTTLARFTGGAPRALQVTGRGGVPGSGVAAVVMNVTVTGPNIPSHVTVWPSGAMPTASNLNFAAGDTVPNLVTVGVSGTGTVNFDLDAGSADLIADVVGYYGDGSGAGASGARYQSLAPSRILDSRFANQYSSPWGAGVTRDLTLPGMPAGATAVVLNVTATNPTAAGFATVWPSGLARPNPASNLNFVPGQTTPNLVIAPIGANGKVSLYNSAGSTDFIADLVGWYGGAGATKLFTPLSTPSRFLDSRFGTGLSGPWTAGQQRDLTIAGVNGVPTNATAVVMNVTVTNPTAASFATVWPSGGVRPDPASNLNFVAGQTVPNLAMVQIGANKNVSFYNNAGSADMIADVVGYFR